MHQVAAAAAAAMSCGNTTKSRSPLLEGVERWAFFMERCTLKLLESLEIWLEQNGCDAFLLTFFSSHPAAFDCFTRSDGDKFKKLRLNPKTLKA